MDIEIKECIKCHKPKEISEFSKRVYANGHFSYRGECKECYKTRQEKYHAEHKEEIKRWHSEYYQNNKNELKIKNDIWWDKNRDKMNHHRKKKRKEKIIPQIPQIHNHEEDIYKIWT